MIELDKIYNEECLEGMKRIPDGSVDAVICDPPYGIMVGMGKSIPDYDEHKHDWDNVIPTAALFEQYERILRRNGTIVLFSQEPYTSHLRTFRAMNIDFTYPMVWKKTTSGTPFGVKIAPLSFYEDINVFRKRVQLMGNNPLRQYFAKIVQFLGVPKTNVVKALGSRAQHCLNTEGNQFALCTADTYADIIAQFHIDKMEGFMTYDELKAIDADFKSNYKDPDAAIFNIPIGRAYVPNVLEFAKDKEILHPTQKPVNLIRYLVQIYTNEGDTVLDNCMGSGTTAIACIREKRHFIGFETNEEFYKKALRRIDNERRQLTLF